MDLVCQKSWPTLCSELAERPLFQGLDLFVIGPFLNQHNVPYQQDELWLNLEERTMSQLWVRLFENGVIKGRRWIIVGCVLRKEMLSAILCKLINNEQKKQASICPIFDCLHVWSVQDRAEELSVALRITGWGFFVMGDVWATWQAVQWLIITIMNSSKLINTSMPSLLLVLNHNVRWTTSSGKQMCH